MIFKNLNYFAILNLIAIAIIPIVVYIGLTSPYEIDSNPYVIALSSGSIVSLFNFVYNIYFSNSKVFKLGEVK